MRRDEVDGAGIRNDLDLAPPSREQASAQEAA